MISLTQSSATATRLPTGTFRRPSGAGDFPPPAPARPMTSDDFRAIEQSLATGHADMAAQLGLAEVSVKRYATGSQPVPEHIARLMVALVVIAESKAQKRRFQELLATYHSDT